MAFVYTEIHVFLSCRKGPTKIPSGKGTPQRNMKLSHAKVKVNTCTVREACLLKKKMKLGFWQFHVRMSCIVTVYFTPFERLSCIQKHW